MIDDRHRSDARGNDRFAVSGIGSLAIGQVLGPSSLRLRLDVLAFSVQELVPTEVWRQRVRHTRNRPGQVSGVGTEKIENTLTKNTIDVNGAAQNLRQKGFS